MTPIQRRSAASRKAAASRKKRQRSLDLGKDYAPGGAKVGEIALSITLPEILARLKAKTGA